MKIIKSLGKKYHAGRMHLLENYKKKHFYVMLFSFFSIYLLFYANTLHEKYPDEFDNILGGRYILHGLFPYSGFFSHHGPVGYFIGALVYLFSGQSFVRFRIVYSIFLFAFFLFTYFFLKKSFGEIKTRFYLGFIIVFGIAATYFWGHMLVADSIAAIFIVPVYALFLLKTFYPAKLQIRELIFISVLSALCLLSSLTYIYLIAFVYLYVLFVSWKKEKIFSRNSFSTIFILAAPYIIFALYLLITRSLSDYIYQSIIFNQKYYIYYEGSKGQVTGNPIRLGIILAHIFYGNYYGLITQIFGFNFGFPFNLTLAIGDVSLCIYLLFKRKLSFFWFFLTLLIYSNARSNPSLSSEKDYQEAVYILLSLLTICFLIPELYSELKKIVFFPQKIIFSGLLIILGIYAFFSSLFLFNKFSDKAYQKYMGTAPQIYDRPQIAPITNAITRVNDSVWIGPLSFEELLYSNRKLPSRYQFLIPAMNRSDRIKNDLLAEFSANKPAVLWFDKNYAILGSSPTDYASFFIDFLNNNYVTLQNLHEGRKYSQSPTVDSSLGLTSKLYINKDQKDAIIQRLLDGNYITYALENEKPTKTTK